MNKELFLLVVSCLLGVFSEPGRDWVKEKFFTRHEELKIYHGQTQIDDDMVIFISDLATNRLNFIVTTGDVGTQDVFLNCRFLSAFTNHITATGWTRTITPSLPPSPPMVTTDYYIPFYGKIPRQTALDMGSIDVSCPAYRLFGVVLFAKDINTGRTKLFNVHFYKTDNVSKPLRGRAARSFMKDKLNKEYYAKGIFIAPKSFPGLN